MKRDLDESKPLFQQIVERIEEEILSGLIGEDEQVPSTNQLAAFYRINPATAAKGLHLLVDEGILYKKRGIGMFVNPGARQSLIRKRKGLFYEQFVLPLIREAEQLQLSREDLLEMIREGREEEADDNNGEK